MRTLEKIWKKLFHRPSSLFENRYRIKIFRGRTALNDEIFDFISKRIFGEWLDIGTNVGVLLREVPHGTGVDASSELVAACQSQGLCVVHGSAYDLPFESNRFETVVMSCLLEQLDDWKKALREGIRVCKKGGRIIGMNPIPGASKWGQLGGWVKSIISEEEMRVFGARLEYPIQGKYFFEITKAD